MKLYEIKEVDVENIIHQRLNLIKKSGIQEIVDKDVISIYGFPLKVVISVNNDEIIVITTYPLKRKREL